MERSLPTMRKTGTLWSRTWERFICLILERSIPLNRDIVEGLVFFWLNLTIYFTFSFCAFFLIDIRLLSPIICLGVMFWGPWTGYMIFLCSLYRECHSTHFCLDSEQSSGLLRVCSSWDNHWKYHHGIRCFEANIVVIVFQCCGVSVKNCSLFLVWPG